MQMQSKVRRQAACWLIPRTSSPCQIQWTKICTWTEEGVYSGRMEEHVRTLRFLLARLERISADSVVAHRASGVRGAMLRVLDQLEKQEQVQDEEVRRMVASGYILLQRAAKERVR